MLNFSRAIELVGKLSRTKKFPDNAEGVDCLARGLQHASETTQVGAGRIIDRCADISEWCPSDAELLTIARDIAREDSVAAGTYDAMAGLGNAMRPIPREVLEAKYGPPRPIDVGSLLAAHRGASAQNRHRQMSIEIRQELRLRPNDDYPGWDECAVAAEKLGYHDYAKAWKNSKAK